MPRKEKETTTLEKPKKPKSAFIFFAADERKRVLAKNANLTFQQIGKLLGENWNSADESVKEKYAKMAEKDKVRYEEDVKKYQKAGGSLDDLKRKSKKTAKSKKKKDANAPKRPSTAFIFFSRDMRPKVQKENPQAHFSEIGQILGHLWKDADESEKKKYRKMAEDDKKRYEKAIKEYESGKKTAAVSSEEEEEEEEEEEDEEDEE